uniref:ORF73a n=1 Tax=Pinus koraiensis TaxID=88728 RepID=A4QM48_PINKO|nr:ORF73a [Pinus koraiensis]
MLDPLVVFFQLVHKDQTPISQDHTNPLHEMLQIRNKLLLRGINEFQILLANLNKVFPYVHHRIFPDPNIPNAR